MSTKLKEVCFNANAFVQAATKVTRAADGPAFFDALREGYLLLHARLTRDEKGTQALALRKAFSKTLTAPAVRMALELCAMPIYEKPILPAGDAPPEFLWIFTLPVVIRFPEALRAEGPLVWDESPLPAEEMLEILTASGRFEPDASLRMFSNLYTRCDLLGWGPENMALHVLNAELSEAQSPMPLPIQFSDECPGYRSVMFFALCAARVPVGVKTLLRPLAGRDDLDKIEQLVRDRLKLVNIPFEDVTVAPPCPVTASCFVSNPAFLQQVSEICHVSKSVWPNLVSAYVKFPMPGYVEIVGKLSTGVEVTLVPAELCCEPQASVAATLERVAREAGLSVAVSVSALLVSLPTSTVH